MSLFAAIFVLIAVGAFGFVLGDYFGPGLGD